MDKNNIEALLKEADRYPQNIDSQGNPNCDLVAAMIAQNRRALGLEMELTEIIRGLERAFITEPEPYTRDVLCAAILALREKQPLESASAVDFNSSRA